MNPQIPPSNLQAEQRVLGVIIRAGDHDFEEGGPIDLVTRVLEPEHFADPIHGEIYQEIRQRIEAKEPFGTAALARAMGQTGTLDEVGGVVYLRQLQLQAEEHTPLGEMARSVIRLHRCRKIIDTVEDIGVAADVLMSLAFAGSHTEAGFNSLSTAVSHMDAALHATAGAAEELAARRASRILFGHPVDDLPPWAATDENPIGGTPPSTGYHPYIPPPHNGDMPADSDIYGEHMLMKTTLDREEVVVLAEFHHAAAKRGLILARPAERFYHEKRGGKFSGALLDIDPMEPPHPAEQTGNGEWDQ